MKCANTTLFESLKLFSESERAKLTKLIRLWEDKNIFTLTTLNKMKDSHASWQAYNCQLKEEYAVAIANDTRPYIDTYNSYEKQVSRLYDFISCVTCAIAKYANVRCSLVFQPSLITSI
jgi:succinate dehydrogenase/fumarate reductase-like Fe-S protein